MNLIGGAEKKLANENFVSRAKPEVVEREREKLESQRSLSVQRGLRAEMLIPENREGEALKLGVLAVGAYGPDWSRPPPPEATGPPAAPCACLKRRSRLGVLTIGSRRTLGSRCRASVMRCRR